MKKEDQVGKWCKYLGNSKISYSNVIFFMFSSAAKVEDQVTDSLLFFRALSSALWQCG